MLKKPKKKAWKPAEQGLSNQNEGTPKQNYSSGWGSSGGQPPALARTPSLVKCLQPVEEAWAKIKMPRLVHKHPQNPPWGLYLEAAQMPGRDGGRREVCSPFYLCLRAVCYISWLILKICKWATEDMRHAGFNLGVYKAFLTLDPSLIYVCCGMCWLS